MKNELEQLWLKLQDQTRFHEWFCACKDCLERVKVGRELIAISDREFRERKARIESWTLAGTQTGEKDYEKTIIRF